VNWKYNTLLLVAFGLAAVLGTLLHQRGDKPQLADLEVPVPVDLAPLPSVPPESVVLSECDSGREGMTISRQNDDHHVTFVCNGERWVEVRNLPLGHNVGHCMTVLSQNRDALEDMCESLVDLYWSQR
jgi:hypothetical protein